MKESWLKGKGGGKLRCGDLGHFYSECEPIKKNHHELQMKSKILCSKNENNICDGSYICNYPYGLYVDSNSVGCTQAGGCD
jgi:hypothetical protein